MWDSPAEGCDPVLRDFPAARLTSFSWQSKFRTDLVFWTNVKGKTGATNDPACRLYASVQTNTWSIDYSINFDAHGDAPQQKEDSVTVSLETDHEETRLAKPVEDSGLEVRLPISLRLQRASRWD